MGEAINLVKLDSSAVRLVLSLYLYELWTLRSKWEASTISDTNGTIAPAAPEISPFRPTQSEEGSHIKKFQP